MNPPRTSKSKRIADLIATEIKNRFVVDTESKLGPSFDLSKISRRSISVFPNGRVCEMLTRSTQKADYQIAIVVMERLSTNDTEDLLADELLEFVESIGDQFVGEILTLPDATKIEVLGYDHEPLYDRETLESHRIFAAAIVLNLTREEDLPNR